MREIMLGIKVPDSHLARIEEEGRAKDPVDGLVLEEEVAKIVDALRRKGVLLEDDDITVNVRGDSEMPVAAPDRRVEITEIFRESDDGVGLVDSYTTAYVVSLGNLKDN